MSTHAFGQQLRREQPIGFHNSLLRVYPAFRLSSSREALLPPSPSSNGTYEFPHMLAQADLSPLVRCGFTPCSMWQ